MPGGFSVSCSTCGDPVIPEGGKCFECASAAVREWVEERERAKRTPKPRRGKGYA